MMMFTLHSLLRYLTVALGVAVIGYGLKGVATKAAYDQNMRMLGGFFAVSMDLTLLVGLALLFVRQFQPYLVTHIVIMVFATAAAHVVPSVMKRRPMEERTYMPHVVGTVAALGLIWAGLATIGAPLIGSRY